MVLTYLQTARPGEVMNVGFLATALFVKTAGERSAGNLHAAFDEGDQRSLWSLLYWTSW